MERLIAEIRAALSSNMFTLGLQGTLALVDICAALESEDGRTRGSRFKAWFSAHVGPKYPWFNADDAYLLRCGLLHQGKTASSQYESIIFTLPGNGLFHDNIINDSYNLDVVTFCGDVLASVEEWWADRSDSDPVATNAVDLIQIRPNGLPPYMVGVPVLA